jgi:FkbM family methyltransferase
MSEGKYTCKILIAAVVIGAVAVGSIGCRKSKRPAAAQKAAVAPAPAPRPAPAPAPAPAANTKGPRIATVPGLGRFVIRDPDDVIQSLLLRGEAWEPYSAAVFEEYVKPGMSVVDIGAYNGVHTVRLAKLVGPTGHVYAFEPNPPTIEMLRENVRLNGVQAQTVVYPVGVSDPPEVGYVKLSDNPHNLGGAHMCSADDVRTHSGRLHCQQATQVKVELVRIDDNIRRWLPTPVSFVKIDVEGHEDRVIAGSRTWLRRYHPVIYIELWSDSKRRDEKLPTTVATMIKRIERLGYRLDRKVTEDDYVFVPKRRARRTRP